MNTMFHILDENNIPFYQPGNYLWDDENRIIGKSKIVKIEISTVFLHCDHNFSGAGDPVLYETMVFGIADQESDICERCCTLKEAIAQHIDIVYKVLKGEIK